MAFTLPKTLVANTPENVNDLNSNLNYLLGVPFTSSGQSFNAGPGTRTNVAYGALGDAADQVTGITIPAAGGLIAVWFQATWQESAIGTARASLFLGANQVKVAKDGAAPVAVEASNPSGAGSNNNMPLATWPLGLLAGIPGAGYPGDVNTGQVFGVGTTVAGSGNVNTTVGGTSVNLAPGTGGPCLIFAAAGTYTVSVQYKSTSGTVTASNRRLYAAGLTF